MQHSDTHTRLYTKPIIEINPYSLSHSHNPSAINDLTCLRAHTQSNYWKYWLCKHLRDICKMFRQSDHVYLSLSHSIGELTKERDSAPGFTTSQRDNGDAIVESTPNFFLGHIKVLHLLGSCRLTACMHLHHSFRRQLRRRVTVSYAVQFQC